MIKVIKTFVRRNFLQNVYKVSEKSKTAEGRILIKNFEIELGRTFKFKSK